MLALKLLLLIILRLIVQKCSTAPSGIKKAYKNSFERTLIKQLHLN